MLSQQNLAFLHDTDQSAEQWGVGKLACLIDRLCCTPYLQVILFIFNMLVLYEAH